MNFFGHVVVASWYSLEPGFALGSMLPDFASMCRGRLLGARDKQVAAGIEFHHRTDRVFHTLDAFNELEHDTTERLCARGVGRGGAMATGHVGVELLLDGLLLDDAGACELYLAALDCDEARAQPADSSIEWKLSEHAQGWATLRDKLSGLGLLEGYRDPDVVTSRLATIFSSRPSLALNDWEVKRIREELPAVRRRVADKRSAILKGLRVQLDV